MPIRKVIGGLSAKKSRRIHLPRHPVRQLFVRREHPNIECWDGFESFFGGFQAQSPTSPSELVFLNPDRAGGLFCDMIE